MTEEASLPADSVVLVTGGCGFIGSHLVRRLVEQGVKEVRVLDSLEYGKPENLGSIQRSVKIIRHTLGHDNPTLLADYLTGVNYLFHLAAEKHNQSKDDPVKVQKANIIGMHSLLSAAVKAGVRKVVFSSSLYVYGRRHRPALVETDLPQPDTVYGISKLTGEHLLRYFHSYHNLDNVSLRYFFVYGPRQFSGLGYKSVIVKNFERILQGEDPTVFGNGEQALDYIYVDDVVDATVKAMVSSYSNDLFNVGSGSATTVNKLIDTMLEVSESSLEKIYLPPDETAGTYRVGNVRKAKKALGLELKVSLVEGLRRTYLWMREQA